jgi:hypothetical protein
VLKFRSKIEVSISIFKVYELLARELYHDSESVTLSVCYVGSHEDLKVIFGLQQTPNRDAVDAA